MHFFNASTRRLRQATKALLPAIFLLGSPSVPAFSQMQELGISQRQTEISTKQQPLQPESGGSCDAALTHLKRALVTGRQLSVPYQQESEAYGDYPEGRPTMYAVAVDGPAAISVLRSSQLLQDISETFIEDCDSAASITIGLYQTSSGVIFGIVDNRFERFGCAEDLGMEPRRGELPWGYYFCNL